MILIVQFIYCKSHRRLSNLIVMFVVITVNFLTGFFMINSLWIPPQCWFNIYRLSIWFLIANLAIGELYLDITTWGTSMRKDKKVGYHYRWICTFMTFMEAFVSFKFMKGSEDTLENNPTPFYISVPWILVLTILTAFYLYLRFKRNHTTIHTGREYILKE